MDETLSVRGGSVHSAVRLWLRLEGALVLLLAIALYAHVGGSWVVFAALFFVPDVSFAAYLADRALAQPSPTSHIATSGR